MTGEPRKYRVVKYARVSTDDQAAEDRFSIDAQISEMDEFIERQGWVSVGEFIDRGISGTKRYRPQLDAMIAMAQRGGFDILVVHELSRLSRSVFDTLDLFQIFGNHGIGFASVKDLEQIQRVKYRTRKTREFVNDENIKAAALRHSDHRIELWAVAFGSRNPPVNKFTNADPSLALDEFIHFADLRVN